MLHICCTQTRMFSNKPNKKFFLFQATWEKSTLYLLPGGYNHIRKQGTILKYFTPGMPALFSKTRGWNLSLLWTLRSLHLQPAAWPGDHLCVLLWCDRSAEEGRGRKARLWSMAWLITAHCVQPCLSRESCRQANQLGQSNSFPSLWIPSSSGHSVIFCRMKSKVYTEILYFLSPVVLASFSQF